MFHKQHPDTMLRLYKNRALKLNMSVKPIRNPAKLPSRPRLPKPPGLSTEPANLD